LPPGRLGSQESVGTSIRRMYRSETPVWDAVVPPVWPFLSNMANPYPTMSNPTTGVAWGCNQPASAMMR
jgi:hypothetical protein